MSTIIGRLRLVGPALVGAVLLASGIAACGGGGSSAPPVASANPQFNWELKFTKCLRGEGIKVADPTPSGGAPEVVHDAAYLNASKACQAKIGEPPTYTANKGNQESYLPTQLKAAKCLRENGYEIADPTAQTPLFIPAEIHISAAVEAKCFPKK